MRFTGKRHPFNTSQADDDFEAALVTIDRVGGTTSNMMLIYFCYASAFNSPKRRPNKFGRLMEEADTGCLLNVLSYQYPCRN
jgi:hypothetical protein